MLQPIASGPIRAVSTLVRASLFFDPHHRSENRAPLIGETHCSIQGHRLFPGLLQGKSEQGREAADWCTSSSDNGSFYDADVQIRPPHIRSVFPWRLVCSKTPVHTSQSERHQANTLQLRGRKQCPRRPSRVPTQSQKPEYL